MPFITPGGLAAGVAGAAEIDIGKIINANAMNPRAERRIGSSPK
jgi:hypothetical protein